MTRTYVVSVIGKCPALLPCAVDGCYRNPFYYYYYYYTVVKHWANTLEITSSIASDTFVQLLTQ